jgi:MinD superfamily P-loop ATPase
MTYVITDECIMCGSCEPFCEQGAIIEDEHNKYFIDLAKCDTCGTCAEYCPIDGAIVEVDEKTLVKN